MSFSAGMYSPRGRYHRWAVFCSTSYTWYFPKRYGKKAAQAMANRLNREAV